MLIEQLQATGPQAIEAVRAEVAAVRAETIRVEPLGGTSAPTTKLMGLPNIWIPWSAPPHVCVDRYTATATEGLARIFREWRASGADHHTISNAGPQAKYAVLMCARRPGETVAIAQSFD
jgi:hypothetical protein